MLRLTIWMNYPALYQGDLFRALVASGEVDLQVIFAKPVTSERVGLGWGNDVEGYSHRFLDKRRRIADAIHLAWSQRDRLHIVNGIWTDTSFSAALVQLALTGSTYAIYSEASDPCLKRPVTRKLLQSALGKAVAYGTSGGLSVSRMAVDFYKSLGVRDEAIYPFGYFTGGREEPIIDRDSSRIEIIFAGQIIHRKGLDLLIEAMLPLFEQRSDLFLTVIGTGEMLPDLENRLASAGASERVTFEGVIPPGKIPARLAHADLLVLPSRWDGWGVVVNEAFCAGVPVIVSDRCGAADLVLEGINGYVFHSEDIVGLRRCLTQFLSRESEWTSFRRNATHTARQISPDTVAPYLIDCLKHMTGALKEKPTPPWAARQDLAET